MKYFKILEISYSDTLAKTFCRFINEEEIKDKESEETKTFTTYAKLKGANSFDDSVEEKTENLEKKTVREITKEEYKKEAERIKEELVRRIRSDRRELEDKERKLKKIEEELAELEKAEA